jgi:DNA-binding NarL/FixJ family response regulator
MRAIRVAIRSDRRLFRDALTASLLDGFRFTVVGHVAGAGDLLALCRLCRPDVVLFDLGSHPDDGLNALDTLSRQQPGTQLIVIHDDLSPAALEAVWNCGPQAVVPESHGLEALMVVLRERLVSVADRPREDGFNDALTDREREIISLVGAGHTAYRIAALLDLNVSAVETAKRRIYHKLGVACQSQAIARAAVLGLTGLAGGIGGEWPAAGPLVAVLRGPRVPLRYQVIETLRRHGILTVAARPADGSPSAWADAVVESARERGRVVVVLVEPEAADWPGAEGFGGPAVLVHAPGMLRADALAAFGRGVTATVPSDHLDHDLMLMLVFALRGCATAHPAGSGGPNGQPAHHGRSAARPSLTSREAEILRSIAAGHSVRETARWLGIAVKTVENTQARLFRKLDARNRAGALASAHALGLVGSLHDPIVWTSPISRTS